MRKDMVLVLLCFICFLVGGCVLINNKEKNSVENKNKMFGAPWINSNIYGGLEENYLPDIKDDFYLNVNNEWLKKAKPWKGNSVNMLLLENEFIVRDRCKKLLKNRNLNNHEAEILRNYNDLFLDWRSRDLNGISELRNNIKKVIEIKDINGLNDYLMTPEINFWSDGLLNLHVETSLNGADKYILEIDLNNIFLRDSADYENLSENGALEKELARKKIFYMLDKMGYDAQKEKIFDNCFEYEKRLAKKIPSRQEEGDVDFYKKINNEMDFDEIKKIFVNFDIERFLVNKKFERQEKYLIAFPEALRLMDSLYSQKNLELIKAYILAHMLVDCSKFLTSEIFYEMQKYDNERNGIKEILSDEDLAYESINDLLRSPMAKIYTENYCNEDEKQDIYSIIKEVIEYYKEMLEENDWLSDQTKKKAIEKLENIKIFSVYSDRWQDYSDLDIKKDDSYLDALKKIKVFELEYNKSLLNKKVEKDLWDTCIMTDAFYDPQKNSIYICAGILGDSVYRLDMSQEEKYAAIGLVIGHEISHAFDTHGAQFDKDGNFKNWWTKKDYKLFNKRAKKLVDYYNGIRVLDNNKKYSGKMIQGEAIADMGGLKAMLGIASKKANFDYDKFFRKYADIWKMIGTRENIIQRVAYDSHPLCYLRVNVTVMQFDEFYKTYKIGVNNKMYIAKNKRIAVW